MAFLSASRASVTYSSRGVPTATIAGIPSIALYPPTTMPKSNFGSRARSSAYLSQLARRPDVRPDQLPTGVVPHGILDHGLGVQKLVQAPGALRPDDRGARSVAPARAETLRSREAGHHTYDAGYRVRREPHCIEHRRCPRTLIDRPTRWLR
jgi:hypothetical protein